MKLWAVVYILGKIAATVGPFSNVTYEDCMANATLQEEDWDAKWKAKNLAHAPEMVVDGVQLKRGDITTTCVYSETRPSDEATP